MLTLRLFSILAGFGAAIGLWRVYRSVPAGVGSRQWICAVFALLGALTGARVGYVLAHPFYYSLHPEQAGQFWLGGFNAFGAFAGAALFALLGGAALHLNVLSALDSTSRMLLPIATLIWLGLWYEGVAYGQALPSGAFLSYPALDETGMLSNRFPLQLIAALSLLLLLGLIEHFTQFKRPGFRFSLVSLGFFTHTLVFSLFRADAVFPIRGIRSDGLLALIFAVAFALLSVLLLLTAARKKDKMKLEENV
jgi:prolipoprotein diacylglyceryltransferase